MSLTATEHSPLLALHRHLPHATTITVRGSEKQQDHASYATELKELLELVYPVVVTTALEFMPGFTSTIQAGHLDSPFTKEYVDAATLSLMFTNISSYSIGLGLASALDTLCSQAHGAKRLERIGIYFQSGLIVIGVCLVPVAFLNWNTAQMLLHVYQDPHVSKLAQVYSRYNMIGVPFVFVYELQRKALQAQGIMTPLIGIAVLANLVQIVTGYWLAYQTSWGFAGVALSRTLGNMSLPLFLWLYFQYRPKHLYQWWTGWDLRAAIDHVGPFLRLGVPGMLMLIMEWWAYEMMSLMAGMLPNPVVAMSAQSVQVNVMSMFYMFFLGFSVAANIRVGNLLGAGLPNRAKAVLWLTVQLVTVLGLCFGIIVFVARSSIAMLFVNDPVTIAGATKVLAMWSPLEVIEGLNCLMQGIFRGVGCQDTAARTNMIAFYVVGMPLAYLLGFNGGFGVEGLWGGFGVALALSASTLFSISCGWNWKALARDAKKRTAE